MAFSGIVHRCFLTVSQEKQNYGPTGPTTQHWRMAQRAPLYDTTLYILYILYIRHNTDAWHSVHHYVTRSTEWMELGRFITNFGFFLQRLLLHGTDGIITFLLPLFPPFFCPIFIFVLQPPADFILVAYFPFLSRLWLPWILWQGGPCTFNCNSADMSYIIWWS